MESVVTSKGAGIMARIDDLGRVVIPKPMRTRLGLSERTLVIIQGDGEKLTLRKYYPDDDLSTAISTMEAQLGELYYSDNLPAPVVDQLSGLASQMREVLTTMGSDEK